jgi:SAM-dependent methyltransferase
MVRTMRSIEEEARVHRTSGPGLDAFLADPGALQALEGATLAEVLAFARDGARRALVVGLEDGGRMALDLLQAGIFVTAVEPDEALIAVLQKAADEAKCGIRLNAYASDYMKREFSAGGFDLALFFGSLGRYNEPLVVLKKAARELRIGGRIFARIRIRPPVAPVTRALARVPGADRVLPKVAAALQRVPGLASFLALPEATAFLDEVAETFKVERAARYHVLAPWAGWLRTRGGTAATVADRAMPILVKADAVLLKRPELALLASYLAFYGAKELQLGKTFRV